MVILAHYIKTFLPIKADKLVLSDEVLDFFKFNGSL